MGFTTDFIGHIDIAPALNQDEIEYLTAFSLSRRFDRSEGPYAVPGNPMAVRDLERDQVGIDTYNRVARGQPELYCKWVPCSTGCCLSFNGHEKFYAAVPWMRYLVAHFLKPGAAASKTGLPAFEHFTFDHRLDGMIVGCRRDTKALFAIEIRHNRVSERVVRPGIPDDGWHEPLEYEKAIDRWADDTRRRRRVPPADGETPAVGETAGAKHDARSVDGLGTVVHLAARRGGSRR